MRILIALIALCLLYPGTAEAHRHARHRHHLHHVDGQNVVVCNNRGCFGTVTMIITKKNHVFADTGGLISKARAYNGMTAREIGLKRGSLWCAAFLRFLGVAGPVDDRAISFRHLRHVSPQVGAIAVYPHHVGIVTGFDGRYPVLISGNSYRHRVYEGTYPRIPIAYVMAD